MLKPWPDILNLLMGAKVHGMRRPIEHFEDSEMLPSSLGFGKQLLSFSKRFRVNRKSTKHCPSEGATNVA